MRTEGKKPTLKKKKKPNNKNQSNKKKMNQPTPKSPKPHTVRVAVQDRSGAQSTPNHASFPAERT